MSYRIAFPILSVIVMAFGLAGCSGQSESIDPTARFSREQLQADMQQMESLIRQRHPGTFTDWSEFGAAYTRQYELLADSLDIVEFHRLVAPVVSAARCGHTRLSFHTEVYEYLREQGNFLPFDLRAVGESLFVYQKYTDQTDMARGSTILAINGQPANEIVAALKDGMWADGTAEGYKYYNINMSLKGRYLLSIADPERFEMIYLEPGAATPKRSTVTALSTNEIKEYEREHDLAESDKPLVEPFFADDSSYASLTIRFFDYCDDPTEYRSILDSFFVQVSECGITDLVLDLRQNDGGDPHGSAHLLTYLLPRPFRYFTSVSHKYYPDLVIEQDLAPNAFAGNLYVLVDGGSYSTTGHLCAILKAYDVATFIGTETGGSFICNGVYEDFTLDHTGLIIMIPSTTFAVDVEGLEPGIGIAPDFVVQATITDMVENRDPVRDKAVELISATAP